MATGRAPKQWSLTKSETVNTFESWRQNLLYTLALDKNFAPFLSPEMKWTKAATDATRGLSDDAAPIPQNERQTAVQKNQVLDLMLGQIANYCPVIARNAITKKSTSLDSIWQTIRAHYGFQSTGAHFLDLGDISLAQDERYEDLYQRLSAFFEDNLLHKDGGITHFDEKVTADEEMTPTVENTIVYLWLNLIDKDLPKLVKQKYGTELRSRTLASIKPEISQALVSLIDELHISQDAKVMRSAPSIRPGAHQPFKVKKPFKSSRTKSCPLCKANRRPDSHFLSECIYLPESDKRFMTRARLIAQVIDDDSDEDCLQDSASNDPPDCSYPLEPSVRRVQVRQSPYLDVFYGPKTPRITIDTGATANLISRATAESLRVPISASSQSAGQADGVSQLRVVGETSFVVTRDSHRLQLQALVVEHLDVPILAGTPFMEVNDVYARPATREVHVGTSVYRYGSETSGAPVARQACVLRAPTQATLWPGDYVEVSVPKDYARQDLTYALEPRLDSPCARSAPVSHPWPSPTIVSSVSGAIRISNDTVHPVSLRRNEHFCQIRPVYCPQPEQSVPPIPRPTDRTDTRRHTLVTLDPDNLLPEPVRQSFLSIMHKYSVFDAQLGKYNGAYGPFQAVVNMGPVQPPQRRGRLPQYNHDKLVDLQAKCDELEQMGVLIKPESAGITVEYVNPSFLVKKPNGGSRLVTAFAEVGQYSKPQPSLMPDVDSTLRQIAQWRYIIATDLTSAFYQIPLAQESLKYCGIVTPFRGIRTYARCAMGMPGSETALEELMCRVLGDLLKDGVVAKLADDLYCGADTPEELLERWHRTLACLQRAGLRLSPLKTIICPRSTTILGWLWQEGSLKASPHRVATLSTCDPPPTVKGLRSFIGAFKALSRVIPHSAHALSPLDSIVAGQQSSDRIEWSDTNLSHFQSAQKVLLSHQTITLPRASDQLWIVTDGALRDPGLGATLYAVRDSKAHVAGFFSAKVRQSQTSWLPCEIEALAIASAVRHFSPYITQSHLTTHVLTDSKPCAQAYERLRRGEFSASPRLTTFLSTVARYHVTVQHLAGSSNMPSDFASRNASPCTVPQCQVCTFIHQQLDATVFRVDPSAVFHGTEKVPYTTRSTWLSLQADCRDLRRTCAHLKQGTRPSRKLTDAKDVKRYLQVASVAHDGLLVVRRNEPLNTTRESIIVPREILHGLLMSLHLKLNHPTRHQLLKVTQRNFYALDLPAAIDHITSGCHQCAAFSKAPHFAVEQSTSEPPAAVGITYAADVLRRNKQYILVIRETVTAFTMTTLLEDEKSDTLRDALLQLCVECIPIDGPPAVIRTDCAPAFRTLANDALLSKHHITLELGSPKNINKNPIAERAIQELEDEIIRVVRHHDRINATSLAIVTAQLNARVRSNGLSARELWLQRDQFTNTQIPVRDKDIISSQHDKRISNHTPSEISKARHHPRAPMAQISIDNSVIDSHMAKKYFVAKSATLEALGRSHKTTIWAVSDRKNPPQPKEILREAFDSVDGENGGQVVLIFSVNNCHGYHGYASMVNKPGDGVAVCDVVGTETSDVSMKHQEQGVRSDIDSSINWHKFNIKWHKLYLTKHGQECLPFTATAHIKIADDQYLNIARNFQELPAEAGEEVCRLIDENYEELCEKKRIKEKERIENLPPPFFQPGEEQDPHVIWSHLVGKVEKMGTVLLACAFGSQRYNLHTPTSDMDMFIVYAADTDKVLGLNPPQPTIKNQSREMCDYTIHEIHRYCELLVGGDPRCVETLYLHPSSIYHSSPDWEVLRSHGKHFLNRPCIEKYLRDALGGKGVKLLDKWLKGDTSEMPSPRLGKLFYIILRLLQNAQDIVEGRELAVYRQEGSEKRNLLMSARNCSVSTAQLHQEVLRLKEDIEKKLEEKWGDGCTQENEALEVAEHWLLTLRFKNFLTYRVKIESKTVHCEER